MKFIQAVRVNDNTIEIFNLDRVLTFRTYSSGVTKILMGAGIFYEVYTDSITPIECQNELLAAIKGATS